MQLFCIQILFHIFINTTVFLEKNKARFMLHLLFLNDIIKLQDAYP